MDKEKLTRSQYVKEEFNKKKTVSLLELYKNLGNMFPEMEKEKLRHNTRSILNSMRESGKIKRVKPGIWEKI